MEADSRAVPQRRRLRQQFQPRVDSLRDCQRTGGRHDEAARQIHELGTGEICGNTLAGGRTFHWTADGSQIGGLVETYRDERIRGDVVRVRNQVDVNQVIAECGYLITGCL